MMSEPFLSIESVSASYGNISALHDVSLEVPGGGIVALLGANGAGKSTTLNVVSGLVRPTRGTVRFDGEPIHRLAADRIVRQGIIQVPEGREIFRDMSVRENLEMGAYTRKDRAAAARDLDSVCDLFPRLRERIAQKPPLCRGASSRCWPRRAP
jgi:branched-chain amino acid transport system ATP-binding protein